MSVIVVVVVVVVGVVVGVVVFIVVLAVVVVVLVVVVVGVVLVLVAIGVRPTIGQKMHVWARRWNCPPQKYSTDTSCRSESGVGSEGHVATATAMNDMYDFVSS